MKFRPSVKTRAREPDYHGVDWASVSGAGRDRWAYESSCPACGAGPGQLCWREEEMVLDWGQRYERADGTQVDRLRRLVGTYWLHAERYTIASAVERLGGNPFEEF